MTSSLKFSAPAEPLLVNGVKSATVVKETSLEEGFPARLWAGLVRAAQWLLD